MVGTDRQNRIGIVRIAVLFLVAVMLGAATIVSGLADYRRSGRFPDAPGEFATLCCTGATLTGIAPAAQLEHVPLAGFPLLEAGFAAVGDRDIPRARLLIAAAVRRDPKLLQARAWLADDAILRRRPDQAVVQLDWLYNLSPGLRARLAEVIVNLVRLPGGLATLKAYVARGPIWSQAVTDQLVVMKIDPRVTYAVIEASPANANSIGRETALIRSMVDRGDIEGAYLTWMAGLPDSAVKAIGYVYDNMLQGLPGGPPFNWTIIDSADASADLIGGGGVRISYFGQGPARVMEQTIVLPPGQYVFGMVARGTGDADANTLSATISCKTADAPVLATLPVRPSATLLKTGARITVPAGCAAQTIAVLGTAAEYPKAADFSIKSISVSREPGQ